MNKKAIELLDKMAVAKRMSGNGYTLWHQNGCDTETARKAYAQYERYAERYDALEQQLRKLLAEGAA